jgi:hypothetical protein
MRELRQAGFGLPNLQRIAAKYPHDRDSNIGTHGGENPKEGPKEIPMSKRVMWCVPAVCTGLLLTAIMLGAGHAALAADDCLAGPSRPPAQGGHWYYRLDHVNNRTCWYRVEPEVRTPTAAAPQPQPSLEAAPLPSLSSFFSSLSAGFAGATTGTQPDTTGDPRIVQTGRPDAAAKPQRPTHTKPLAEHADEGSAAPLGQAERDALFQEFLRWRERQIP